MLNIFSGTKHDDKYIEINPNLNTFRFGQGFFTTTRIHKGLPLWIDEHIARLDASLQAFYFPSINLSEIKRYALQWANLNKVESGIMRILVWPDNEISNYYISGSLLPPKDKNIKLEFASYKRHSTEIIYRYKSFNYWQNLLVHQEAERNGYWDGIILNEKEEICETSRGNIFWIKGDTIYTPHLECNLLDGVMRKQILSISDKLGIKNEEVRVGRLELETASTVFITNSVRGIIPVKQIGSQKYKEHHELVEQIINAEKYIMKN
ncbi:MAG TPA: aminotransferase class IV [Syntrophomonadaceae bacterium]|nr:aminotransferase class IV [Syntrophomonadaceae bacterium]